MFGENLFSDPAWEILLAMLLAELTYTRLAVTEASMAGDIPATTGLRWINVLEAAGMVRRTADPLDDRRIFLELTKKASLDLRKLLATYENASVA